MPILEQEKGRLLPVRPSPVSGDLECRMITGFGELEKIAPEWQRLWHSNPRGEIFQSFPWARAWWECFGSSLNLYVPVVYAAGEAALILPLVERCGKLRFLGSPQADYSDMLCGYADPAKALAFAFRSLLQSVPEWKECVLEPLHPDGALVQAVTGLPTDLRRLVRLQASVNCPTIIFDGNRDAVIEPLLAGKHVRRRLQNLRKAGTVAFRHLEDKEEAQRHLTDFLRCHRRRCALLAKESCFEDSDMRSLMRALLDALNLRQELRFGVLELDGRPLAWSFGFQVNGKYSYYNQTFDVDAEEYAPGEVLLHYLLSYALENVDREFDFLRGDEFFKSRFATHVRQTQMLSLQRVSLSGKLRGMRRSLQAQVRGAGKWMELFARTHAQIFRIARSITIRKREITWRLRSAKLAGTLNEYLAGSALDFARRSILSRRQAIVFAKNNAAGVATQPECFVSAPGIHIASGCLSDLIDLALEHPEIPFPDLRECRNRLRRGDHVYLIRENEQIALVAWAGIRPASNLPEDLDSGQVAIRGAVVMYECWPIHHPEAGCRSLLKSLGEQASGERADLVVYCPALPLLSQLGLQKQGFIPKSRIVSHTILHWLRRSAIRDCATTGDQRPSQPTCPKLTKRK